MMAENICVNINRCLACRSCELACSEVHSRSGKLEEAVTESPLPARMVSLERAGGHAVPLRCINCEDAPCAEICPMGALKKAPDGTVSVQADLCTGCKMCMIVCPLGVLHFTPDGRCAVMCDSCTDLQENNQQPACVRACPTGALKLKQD